MSLDDDVKSIDPEKRRELYAPYSEAYKNIAFQVWYSNERPGAKRLISMLPEDEFHRRPNERYILEWLKVWNEEADLLDLEVKKQVDIDLVAQRANMLRRQADAGKTLQEKAMEYINQTRFDKMADAIRALVEGVRIERDSRGLGEALDRIFKMDDEALRKELLYLLERNGDSSVVVIDGETTVLEVDDGEPESTSE